MRHFSLVAGISTTGRSMRLALRSRVSMSAIGSVIIAGILSPAGLLDARDQAVAGHAAEADPADAELAVHGPRPPAQSAAEADADLVAGPELLLVGRPLLVLLQRFQLAEVFGAFGGGGHRRALKVRGSLTPRGRACRTAA